MSRPRWSTLTMFLLVTTPAVGLPVAETDAADPQWSSAHRDTVGRLREVGAALWRWYVADTPEREIRGLAEWSMSELPEVDSDR